MRLRRIGILTVGLAAILAAGPAWGQVIIDTASVGNPGNPAYSTGFGSVSYPFAMGRYEVTLAQYCVFLNAVAETDTYALWHSGMTAITRSGSSGNYTYAPKLDGDRPVQHVRWSQAARFANWMHNGQPTGAQDLTTTEDGSYYLNGAVNATDLYNVDRKVGATWVIPSADEWVKAAYFNPATHSYYTYPTSSIYIEWDLANY